MPPCDVSTRQPATLSPLLDGALELERRDELLAEVRKEQPGIAALLEDLLADHERLLQTGFLELSPHRSLEDEDFYQRTLGWWLAAERTYREAIGIERGVDTSGERARGRRRSRLRER